MHTIMTGVIPSVPDSDIIFFFNHHAILPIILFIIILISLISEFLPRIPNTPTENGEKVRIVFLLTLNGRALRQVHRLINALYRSYHYFYIHVDKVH